MTPIAWRGSDRGAWETPRSGARGLFLLQLFMFQCESAVKRETNSDAMMINAITCEWARMRRRRREGWVHA